MAGAFPYWLHLLGATLWIGPQFMLALIVAPAVRSIPDEGLRGSVLRRVTSRFGMLSVAALAILILTGIDNIARLAPDGMFHLRFGWILVAKLVMVALAVLATVYHGAVVGPRLLRAIESGDTALVSRLRRSSMAASMFNLVLALAILFAAALLGTPDFSLVHI